MTVAPRVIPCLDVNGGRVVKGTCFLDLRDAGDPAELAARYDEDRADELVLFDITASHEGRATLLETVQRVADAVFIPLTVGGGIDSLDTIDRLLRIGADKVSLNTAALNRPGLITEAAARFGEQCIVVSIDARRVEEGSRAGEGSHDTEALAETPEWDVYTHGGRRRANREVIAWAREAVKRGAGELVLNSMDRDGMADGYDLELTRAVAAAVAVPVIASGGAGHPEHLRAVLVEGGADAALAATIFHWSAYPIPATKAYLRTHGVAVRP